VDILSVDKSIMTDDNCRSAHDNGKKFNVQTVNTEEEINSAIKVGADSYFTDEAALAAGLEKE
jgi:glycerophosphoryl diester phosphodiesterase